MCIGFAEKSHFVQYLLTDIVFQFGGTCDLENLAFCSISAYIGFGSLAASKRNTRFCSTSMKQKCNICFAVLGKTGEFSVFSATLCIVQNIFIGCFFKKMYLILYNAQ